MRHVKKAISLLLVFIMLFTTPMTALATVSDNDNTMVVAEDSETFYKIVHVDAGRKYFSPESIKNLIDNAAESGFNQVELYLSDNQGFRFALDNMTIETEYGTYDLTPSLGDGYSQTVNDNKRPDGSNKYLTQSEMTDIIAYAKTKGIEIVPCINVPGHMGAILENFTDFRYKKGNSTSKSSISLDNEAAVAFALGLTKAYAQYFASQGVKYYNVGADEYANDLSSMGFEGMGSTLYTKFVEFLNDAADIVIEEGMIPRAFNDGFYYKDYNISVEPNKAYEVCYWSSGWGGYDVAAASTIANKGHKMINTAGGYYWILGGSKVTAANAAKFNYKAFEGNTTINEPAGAMFCIWCDDASTDGADGGTKVVSDTKDVIAAFGSALPVTEQPDVDQPETMNTIPDGEFGLEVTGLGLTEFVCKQADAPVIDGVDHIVAYDMKPMKGETEYTGEATVSVPVPEGWNTDNMGAFVVEENGSVTKISGTYADGKYTFTMPHFSVGGIYDVAKAAEDDGERTITLVVGQTKTEDIAGVNYSANVDKSEFNESIASVSASYTETPGSTEVTKATSVTNGGKYIIGNGNGRYMVVNGNTISSTTDVTEATEFTITGSGANIKIQSGDYYLRHNSNSLNLSTTNSNNTWSYDGTRFYYTVSGAWGSTTTYRLSTNSSGTWRVNTNSSSNQGAAYTVVQNEPIKATTVVFTGNKVGTTYVTVGNVRYTVNVVAEDLSAVTPLKVEYWNTNISVTANGDTSKNILATDSSVNSAKGIEIVEFIPELGNNLNGEAVRYWKTTCLDSENHQTDEASDNETSDGADFKFIRYWGGNWAYSVDGNNWVSIKSSDQIVAYYLQRTTVTDEVETQVVDWGVVPSTDYNSSNFVLVDYAVRYESGERVPDSYPVSGKTMAFHCDPGDKTTVHQYNNGSSSTWYNNYRDIGMIKAVETMEYEVYMITLTPTNDSRSTQVASNANTASSYSYEGTEKVIWVDEEANLGRFADESLQYTSISGNIKFSVGGEPIVQGLEIFNRHGMLVTYYVRAKATEDALRVHYVDDSPGANGFEFYNYNIAVKEGTVFNTNIGLNTSNPNSDLVNGTVTNFHNKPQTVSADLSTLSQVGAQYLYSQYECVKVERSADGKDVYLHYTFNPTVYFMADFGLSVDIKASDLNSQLTDSIVDSIQTSGAYTAYGRLSVNGKTVTYTPNKTLAGADFFTLVVNTNQNVSGILEESARQIAFRVYVLPATNVYYEEGFASFDGFKVEGTALKSHQTTEFAETEKNKPEKKINNYGYDPAYDSVGASNGTQATSTAYGDTSEFKFTGTGVDIYTNSTPDTGTLFIQVKNSANKTVKMVQVKTALIDGKSDATTGQAVSGYNIPVASLDLGTKDTYTAKITHMKPNAAATGDTVNLDGFRVYGTLNLATEAYVNDLEDNPAYYELRDVVLHALGVKGATSEQVYNATADSTAIITDNSVEYDNSDNVQDLLNNGPKNELYLQKDQTLTFNVKTDRLMQLGLKALDKATEYTVEAQYVDSEGATKKLGGTKDMSVSTEMFYPLNNPRGEERTYTVSITNNGDGILSVTDLKICDDPNVSFEPLTQADIEKALFGDGTPDPAPGTPDTPVDPQPGTPEPSPEPGVPTPGPGTLEHKCKMKEEIKPATTKKDGEIVVKCTECGEVESTKVIYKASNVKLSKNEFVYNGKVKSPKLTIKDSKGNTIAKKYYSVSKPAGRKDVGKYTYTIKFKGLYEGTKKLTLTVKPKATSVKKVTASKKAFTVKWNKVSKQATGYEIMYATNAKFSKGKHTVKVTKLNTTSKKISKLKAKQKYYVKVRTYKTVKVNGKKTNIYSAWSSPKTITVKK